MKIFSASVQQTADSFLHAGYVSAQPPAQALEYPPLTDTADTGFSTTLDSAFGLAEPTTADGAMTIFPGLTEALAAAAPVAAVLVGFALLAWAMVSHHQRAGARPAPLGASMLLYALLATGLFVACVENPWNNVDPEDYEDPDTATLVLMHSLLKEGLAVHHWDVGQVHNLASIEDQVAIPTKNLDEGLDYALASYGRDGWGHDFVLEGGQDGAYTVTSSGPDGELETDDDVHMDLDASDVYDHNRTFYLTRRDGALWVVIRANAELSNSWDSESYGTEGEYLVGEAFYGIPLSVEYLEANAGMAGHDTEQDWGAVIGELTAFYEGFATEANPDPIVVQIFDA